MNELIFMRLGNGIIDTIESTPNMTLLLFHAVSEKKKGDAVEQRGKNERPRPGAYWRLGWGGGGGGVDVADKSTR